MVGITVIYRALDPFNIEEGEEIVAYMSCTKFYTVPKQFPLSSLCYYGEGENGTECTNPCPLPQETIP